MIRQPAMLVMLVAGLAGCGDIPQPFRHEGPPGGLARPKLTRGVVVRAPETDANGQAMAESLVKALEEQEIPAQVHAGPAFGHVIEGVVHEDGPMLAVRWSLKAPDGTQAATHVEVLPKAVAVKADPVQLKRAAAETARALSLPLADPDARPETANGAAITADSRSTVQVRPLRGLPGDGDKSLTNALKRALERAGLKVVDASPEYFVEGAVSVAPGLPGEDTVTVVWTVKRTKDGSPLGNIDQGGAVPKGRLSGPWGLLARDIAEGGATGLVEVVRADISGAKRK